MKKFWQFIWSVLFIGAIGACLYLFIFAPTREKFHGDASYVAHAQRQGEEAQKTKAAEDLRKQQQEIERQRVLIQKAQDSLTAVRERGDALEFLNAPFSLSGYDSQLGLVAFTEKYEAIAVIIRKYERSDDPELVSFAKTLKQKLVAHQVKTFPKLRKRWGELLNHAMWIEDGYCSVSGEANNVVNYTHSSFSLNRRVAEFQQACSQELRSLRFSQARYRWFRGASEYTYFTMDSKKDSEV